jgi:hypothetical protein
MNSKTKIRFDAIEPAGRALESLPEFKAERITKAHAVQLLTKQIRGAQTKGYSMEAIAKVLVEQNVSIPISSLRAYLSEGSAGARRKVKRRKVCRAEDSKAEPTAAREPGRTAATPAAQPPAPAAKPRPVVSASSVDRDWDPAAPAEKKVTPTSGGFVVRPDRERI